jgi:hypothetical protein
MTFARKFLFILLMLVIAVGVAACGGDDDDGGDDDASGNGDVPSAASAETRMSEALAAIFSFDAEAIGPYICEDQQAALETALEEAVTGAGLTTDILEELSVDVSAVDWTIEVDGDTATADATGEIVLTILGQDQPQDAGELFGEPVPLTVEDGEWVICDPNLVDALGN